MPNLLPIFLTGLITGGLTCLAVQGGLLATTIAQRQTLLGPQTKSSSAITVALFLVSKLFAYTLFGFLLGWLGSLFIFSLKYQAVLQISVAVFMLGTALALLEVHPIFRYFIIQPPKILTKAVRGQAKSASWFSPVVLGLMTVFVPCGTTQAMMALAVASGQPLYGALILFSFVIGTSPLFFILGFIAGKFKEKFDKYFRPVAASLVMLVALIGLNTGLNLLGSPITLEKSWQKYICSVSFCQNNISVSANDELPSNVINITIDSRGYTTDRSTIKAGDRITLNLINKGGGGCAAAFTIPKLGIQKIAVIGQTSTINFVAPSDPGVLDFICSMGMYKGRLKVV